MVDEEVVGEISWKEKYNERPKIIASGKLSSQLGLKTMVTRGKVDSKHNVKLCLNPLAQSSGIP